ncbi:MAG: metal ABC transporter permease [Candidatus Omnitrophica bacterium]|nr:metal ABC transporter permease [Candidatus Omnitrophota bacterium]
MHGILEPLQYVFIQRALLASVLVGVSCSFLGVYVVLRRISNIGHALTHSALPGIVIAFMCGANLFLGALIAVLFTALMIGFLSKDDKISEDTATGMMPTIMFALGVLLISASKSYRDMSSMLFGNILGVSNGDLWLIGTITVVIVLALVLCHKELQLFCVDRDYAQTIGINVEGLRLLLLILLSLSVVTGIQATGAILTNALLIVPTAAARLVVNQLIPLMITAVSMTVACCIAGVYCSYYFGFSSGASIVLCCGLCFGISWLFRAVQNRKR